MPFVGPLPVTPTLTHAVCVGGSSCGLSSKRRFFWCALFGAQGARCHDVHDSQRMLFEYLKPGAQSISMQHSHHWTVQGVEQILPQIHLIRSEGRDSVSSVPVRDAGIEPTTSGPAGGTPPPQRVVTAFYLHAPRQPQLLLVCNLVKSTVSILTAVGIPTYFLAKAACTRNIPGPAMRSMTEP
eukprot:365412-Chlamydomonas_euryale.AAC.30